MLRRVGIGATILTAAIMLLPASAGGRASGLNAEVTLDKQPWGVEVTVKNTGTVAIKSVVFKPSGFTIVALGAVADAGYCKLAAGRMVCDAKFSIPPGGTVSFTIKTWSGSPTSGSIWINDQPGTAGQAGPFHVTGEPASTDRLTGNVSVSKVGTGQGTVTSTPPGINCGRSCFHTYDDGTRVKLTAAPSAGSTFKGWSLSAAAPGSACPGTGPCTVTADYAYETLVTADFERKPDVSLAISGTKTIHWHRFSPEHLFGSSEATYKVQVTNHGPGGVNVIAMTVSWFDGRSRPRSLFVILEGTFDERKNNKCDPKSGEAHRITCLLGRLRSGETREVSLLLPQWEGRFGGDWTSDERALVESGKLVIKADVKVREEERDGPFAKDTNNHGELVSTYEEVK